MQVAERVPLTPQQIILMNFGFFGIQYSFGMQQTAINPIFSFLHADAGSLPLLNMAGPITGLIIQPIIGAMSDRTWSPRWGRRKPYFLVGALGCSLCLFFYPFCMALWMAVLLLWLLDASNNTAMEPYRAFIADKLPARAARARLPHPELLHRLRHHAGQRVALRVPEEHRRARRRRASPTGCSAPSSSARSAPSAASACRSGPRPRSRPRPRSWPRSGRTRPGAGETLAEIGTAIRQMPVTLWQLALVYLFQWYAMFCYWQFVSLSIAKSVYGATAADPAYSDAVAWTGLVNGFYNVVTFLSAFGLMWAAKRYSARLVHASALVLAAVALVVFPHIGNKYLLFVPMVGFGIAWASMMGVPYIMAVAVIPRARYGVYMGIINMMIVIPMLIQTVTFGAVYDRLLGADPAQALTFAGVLLLLAAGATMMIAQPRGEATQNMPLEGRLPAE